MIGDKRRRSTTLEDEKRNSRKDVHFSRSSSVENSPPEERDKEGLIHIKTGAMLHGRCKSFLQISAVLCILYLSVYVYVYV